MATNTILPNRFLQNLPNHKSPKDLEAGPSHQRLVDFQLGATDRAVQRPLIRVREKQDSRLQVAKIQKYLGRATQRNLRLN